MCHAPQTYVHFSLLWTGLYHQGLQLSLMVKVACTKILRWGDRSPPGAGFSPRVSWLRRPVCLSVDIKWQCLQLSAQTHDALQVAMFEAKASPAALDLTVQTHYAQYAWEVERDEVSSSAGHAQLATCSYHCCWLCRLSQPGQHGTSVWL